VPVRVLFPDRETRAVAVVGRAPVPDQEVHGLRALLVGLFALALVTQAAAAASGGTPSSTSKTTSSPSPRESTTSGPAAKTKRTRALSLDERLDRKLTAVRRARSTIRFFESHPGPLRAERTRTRARASLRAARGRLTRLEESADRLQAAIDRRAARRLAKMSPRAAICEVFERYCQAAVAVAWCESRLSTSAQNGQYLGLFQMGEQARRLFGHGPTAHEQAVAAHRYFVRSGRDWSPWSCGWAAT